MLPCPLCKTPQIHGFLYRSPDTTFPFGPFGLFGQARAVI